MMDDEDLRQADLSHLTIKDMNAKQRAEIRRRFEHFVRAVAGDRAPVAVKPEKRIRKWVPGMKGPSER
jgi:hypothetical protein